MKDVFALVEPGYHLPSRTHVTNILKRNYQLGLEALRGLLNIDEATTLSFTTDGLDERSSQSLPDPDWALRHSGLFSRVLVPRNGSFSRTAYRYEHRREGKDLAH